MKHATTCKASSVTPIWKPLGQRSSLNQTNLQLKKQKFHLNLWRIAQLLMRRFSMRNFYYCF